MFPVAVFTVLGQKGDRDSARGIVGVQLQVFKAGNHQLHFFPICPVDTVVVAVVVLIFVSFCDHLNPSRDTGRMVPPTLCACPDNTKMSTGTQTLTATCFRSPPSTSSSPPWSWAWRWPWLVTLGFRWILAAVSYGREQPLTITHILISKYWVKVTEVTKWQTAMAYITNQCSFI